MYVSITTLQKGGIFGVMRLCKVVLLVVALFAMVGLSLPAYGADADPVCVGSVSKSMRGAIRGAYCGPLGASDLIEMKPSHNTARVTWSRIANSVYRLHWAEVYNTDSTWDLPYSWTSDNVRNLRAVTEYRHTNDCDNWPLDPSAWSDTTAYAIGAVVSHDGRRYQAVVDSTGVEPGVTADWKDSWTGPGCTYEPLTVANFLPQSVKEPFGIGSVTYQWDRRSLYIGPQLLSTTGHWSQCTTDAIAYYDIDYRLPLKDTDEDGNTLHDGAWCWETISGLKPSTGYTYVLERYLKEGSTQTLQGRFMGSFRTQPAPITVTLPLAWEIPRVTLSSVAWDWKDDPGAIYGYILTHQQKGFATIEVDVAAGTSEYIVSGLSQGTEYCATVVPKDGNGDPVEAYRSPEYCVTTEKPFANGMRWDNPPVSSVTSRSISWHWVSDPPASRYRIQVYEKGASDKGVPIDVDGRLSSYVAIDLRHSTEYCAVVWPVDYSGHEHTYLASPEHCVSTIALPAARVSWADPAYSDVSSNSITWNWVSDPVVVRYHVQMYSHGQWSLAVVSGTSSSYTFNNLSPSTKHCTVIWPLTRDGLFHSTLRSTEQCVYTKHNITDAQKRFTSVKKDHEGVRWAWDHYGTAAGAQGVTGYDVQWWYNDGITDSTPVWHEKTLSSNAARFSVGPQTAVNYYYDITLDDWDPAYSYCLRVVPVTGADRVRALDKAFLQVDTAGDSDYDCLTPEPEDVLEVGVSAGGAVEEGEDVVFTVTASSAPASDLTVFLYVREIHSNPASAVVRASFLQAITIPAGQTSATYTHTTFDDDKRWGGGRVAAYVVFGAGYAVSETADFVSVAITDND